jgi:hypothetical protein
VNPRVLRTVFDSVLYSIETYSALDRVKRIPHLLLKWNVIDVHVVTFHFLNKIMMMMPIIISQPHRV